MNRRAIGWGGLTLGVAFLFLGAPVRADCLLEETPNTSSDNLTTLFPNWLSAPVAVFDIEVCTDAACPGTPSCNIQSLTIYNYGNANGTTDLTRVYFNLLCGKTNATATLTYAGNWMVSAKSVAAWTWTGPIVWAADPGSSCAGMAQLSVYADVGPCPTNGAEVTMGLGYNDVLDPAQPGGLWDTCGCQVPSYPEVMTGRTKYIQYVTKVADQTIVAPGDTVTYTIYYGRPGATVTGYVITDTLPAYTHYLAGTASTPPDTFWDPDPGPPMRLRWTLPGPGATTGGGTSALNFSVSVDWGNGESFEPGSGNTAAPEGSRLANVAAVEFLGSACPSAQMNPPVDAIVRRYLVWETADQDILFAPRLGMPDDEIIYSIYVRNMSSTKTWWQVSVWDTVPPELTSWAPTGAGFYDGCASAWTMTPTAGCSPAGPGYVVNGGNTILTWKLDMPPGATLQLQWKGVVRSAGVTAGATAIAKVSVMELGDPGQAGGTGHAGKPRSFIHVAPIVLRTTYFSYVSQVSDSTSCDGVKINFYPLNKAAAFELRKLFYSGAGFANVGGKSASITALNGTCLGGYTDGGYAGCGPERAPSQYEAPAAIACPAAPNAALYKLTGNAPVDWILMPNVGGGGDAFTYIPSTTFSHSGYTLYSYRRSVSGSTTPGWGESWIVFNTSLDVAGTYDPTTSTTVHIFKWNAGTLSWDYVIGNDIDANSLWMPFAGCTPSDENHYKIISSDERLLVCQGYGTIGDPNITFAYNDHGNYYPNAENGLKVSTPGSAGTFYCVCYHDPTSVSVQMIVGNQSPTSLATYRVYHYRPRNPGLATSGIPASLCDNSGSWDLYGIRTADPGIGGADNGHVFGQAANFDHLTMGTNGTANAWKIEWVSGGNISVIGGTYIFSAWAGGSVMAAVNGKATGQEFWFHQASNTNPLSWAITFFATSTNMAVNATSNDGFSATYTTDGPDQCIMFTNLSPSTFGGRRNYDIRLLAGGAQGELVAQYHQGEYREKFFTAPFVVTGVHYDILAPPVVFSGQPFWITIAVVLGSGNTKQDYCGTSSFTSTDPGGLIEGLGMDTYNFTWTSSIACSSSPDENGVRIFFNVVMYKLGPQSISAIDTTDGSINGVAAVTVIGVDVKLFKQPRLTVAASGDTVQFRVCWSNYSGASGFSFTITDAVPMGTTYIPDVASNQMCGAPPGVTADVAYSLSTSAVTPAPASFITVPPASTLPGGVRWLRWTVNMVTVNATGCACYRVTVN